MNAPRQVDEEARRRSEAATQQLMRKYEGGSNVGVKLMAKMGYGAAGMGHQTPVLGGAYSLSALDLH